MAGAKQSGPSGADDRAEIFDPKTNVWQIAAYHESTDGGHSAALLTDGRVLIAGGRAESAIYDPVLNTWQSTGKLGILRSQAQAVLLRDGHVLLTGGIPYPEGDSVLDSIEVYDPVTNTWRPAALLTQARCCHTATSLPDGRVLVVGGWNSVGGYEAALLKTTEIYDDQSGTWSTLASTGTGRVEHTTTLLLDGRILVTGGELKRGVFLNSAEVLAP